MLHAKRRNNKYQFYSLWFDLIRDRTHNLPHSRWACLPLQRWACLPLHHWWGYIFLLLFNILVVFLFLSCHYLISIFSKNEAIKESTNEVNKQCQGDLELAQLTNEPLNMKTVCKWDFVNGKKKWHNELILLFYLYFTCYLDLSTCYTIVYYFICTFFKIYFWITQGFQYFSSLPVLHYLQCNRAFNIFQVYQNFTIYNVTGLSIFFKSISSSLFTM